MRYEILYKILNRLKHCQLERKLAAKMDILMSSRRLVIELSTRWQSITFEVLPAFDALGKPSWVCVGGAGVWRGVLTEKSQRKGWWIATWSSRLGRE